MVGFPSILEGIKDLEKGHILQLLERAEDLKSGSPARLPLQKSLAVATSFLEHSTRTKHSFAMAIKRLGGFHIDFQAENSSLKKGESLEQTLLTLHYQGIDICIIRTQQSHLLEEFKEHPPIKIINGGDGSNQHPTQALLDLYTFTTDFGSIKDLEGKTISIIGDCRHSRVTHSLIDLLPKFGINVVLCGPPEFMPDEIPAGISVLDNIDDAIIQSDALYLLRIQSERHGDAHNDIFDNYHAKWGVNFEKLKQHSKVLPIYHPGPANIGVEVNSEIMNSEIWMAHKQVENSVYMRMAIIEAMINNEDHNIGSVYNKVPGDICEGNSQQGI
jgi:aspartate carbamoyltransferase catalytic subunit